MEVTQSQMTTPLVAARQHPDLKLFSVRLPWWPCLRLLSCQRRQLASRLLLSLLSSASPPPIRLVHLQRVADPRSRQHVQRCWTRAQREPSFHPWHLSRSTYKVLHWIDTVTQTGTVTLVSVTGLPNNTRIAAVEHCSYWACPYLVIAAAATMCLGVMRWIEVSSPHWPRHCNETSLSLGGE